MRYWIRSSRHGVLGGAGFAAVGCQLAPRDRFIGCSADARLADIGLVASSQRLLILPGIRVRWAVRRFELTRLGRRRTGPGGGGNDPGPSSELDHCACESDLGDLRQRYDCPLRIPPLSRRPRRIGRFCHVFGCPTGSSSAATPGATKDANTRKTLSGRAHWIGYLC